MGGDSEVKIQIPQSLIGDLVRAQIVKELGGNEKLIETVIRTAMEYKKDSYSSTPTLFQESVTKMIVKEATEVFQEWLEANRGAVREAFIKYLNGNKQKKLKEMAEGLAANIEKYGVRTTLTFREKE